MNFQEAKNIVEEIQTPTKESDIIISDIISSGKKENIVSVNIETDITFKSSVSNENTTNDLRLRTLEKEFTSKLKLFITEEAFEYGYENKADVLVKEQMVINRMATKEWLSNIFTQNYGNHEIMIGILRLISRFDINEVSPQGKLMAISAISHKDSEIKECAIRAFESWASLDSIELLRNIEVEQNWLKEYLNSVIQYIESEYGVSR